MAYSVPTTASGQVLTSAIWNASVRDNIIYLQDRVDNPPRAAIYHNTTQSIANATATAVTWNSEYSDAAAMHSTGVNPTRLTIPTGQSGWWLFTVFVEFAANATGQRELALRFDGSAVFGQVAVNAASAGATRLGLSIIIQLNAASYIEAVVTQNSLGALNLATSPYFAAQRIA